MKEKQFENAEYTIERQMFQFKSKVLYSFNEDFDSSPNRRLNKYFLKRDNSSKAFLSLLDES